MVHTHYFWVLARSTKRNSEKFGLRLDLFYLRILRAYLIFIMCDPTNLTYFQPC